MDPAADEDLKTLSFVAIQLRFEGRLERPHDLVKNGHGRVERTFRSHRDDRRDDILLAGALSQTVDELGLATAVIAFEVFEASQAVGKLASKIVVIERIKDVVGSDIDEMRILTRRDRGVHQVFQETPCIVRADRNIHVPSTRQFALCRM